MFLDILLSVFPLFRVILLIVIVKNNKFSISCSFDNVKVGRTLYFHNYYYLFLLEISKVPFTNGNPKLSWAVEVIRIYEQFTSVGLEMICQK